MGSDSWPQPKHLPSPNPTPSHPDVKQDAQPVSSTSLLMKTWENKVYKAGSEQDLKEEQDRGRHSRGQKG